MDTYVYRLLVDISEAYSTRVNILQVFMALDYRRAHPLTELMLRLSFGLLYTRLTMIFSGLGFCLHLLLPFLTLASLILFSTGQKYHGYNATDVKVTYILFSGTVLLDFLFLFLGPWIGSIGSVKVSQYSLLECGFRTKRLPFLIKIATLLSCKDYVNMTCYIEQAPPAASDHVAQLVHAYVRGGWNEYIHDAATYRRFNNHRGQWTLRKHRHLSWSLNMAFDRSVLLWHIATDLCFRGTTNKIQECVAGSMVISNYMAYLLCIRPEMLMPGTRNTIFAVACHDVELMVHGKAPLGDLVVNAHKLHQELLEMPDEVERWEMVQGVWIEMICYSAGRCRGYLHAKNLSEGVEMLSRVWLLLSFMGMETFAEEEAKHGGEGGAIENEIDNTYQKPGPSKPKEEEGKHSDEAGAIENEINDMYEKSGPPETKDEKEDKEGGSNNDGEGRAVQSEITIDVV